MKAIAEQPAKQKREITPAKRRHAATVYLSQAQHARAFMLAQPFSSISEVLARGLAMAISNPPEKRPGSPRHEGEKKTTVLLTASLHARAKRAIAEGGTLQDLLTHGLELMAGR